MNSLLLLLTLTLSAPLAALTPPGEPDNPAALIKAAIARDWVARSDSAGVEIRSPSYAMPYKQGCVIHNLFFPIIGAGPTLGRMLTYDQYFVFASDDACATADPAQFFSIEPANDTMALLDFSKRLKNGPRLTKDKISKADYAQISACFTPEALANTRIVGAHSWREKGNGRDDRYQVTLRCEALDEAGQIIALGVIYQDAIDWSFKPWGPITMDVPVPNQ